MISAASTSPRAPSSIASARVCTRIGSTDSNSRSAYFDGVDLLAADLRSPTADAGTSLRNATFGLSRPAGQREPDQQRDRRARVGEQQRHQQRRAAQDPQVLEQQPAHLSGRARAGTRRTPPRSRVRVVADLRVELGRRARRTAARRRRARARGRRSARPRRRCGWRTPPSCRRAARPPTNSHSRSRWRGSSDDGRLVEQQHRRVGEQADGDVHALAVAARQRAELVAGAVAQPGLLEHPRRRPRRGRRRSPAARTGAGSRRPTACA